MDRTQKTRCKRYIDYRKLNDKTIEDKYPLPRMDDILGNLDNFSYFGLSARIPSNISSRTLMNGENKLFLIFGKDTYMHISSRFLFVSSSNTISEDKRMPIVIANRLVS